jgi:hypothetical protein
MPMSAATNGIDVSTLSFQPPRPDKSRTIFGSHRNTP